MPKSKTISDSWLSNPEYNDSLSKKDEVTARCSYCCKDVDVSNMGEAALRIHKKSKREKIAPQYSNLSSFSSFK